MTGGLQYGARLVLSRDPTDGEMATLRRLYEEALTASECASHSEGRCECEREEQLRERTGGNDGRGKRSVQSRCGFDQVILMSNSKNRLN